MFTCPCYILRPYGKVINARIKNNKSVNNGIMMILIIII